MRRHARQPRSPQPIRMNRRTLDASCRGLRGARTTRPRSPKPSRSDASKSSRALLCTRARLRDHQSRARASSAAVLRLPGMFRTAGRPPSLRVSRTMYGTACLHAAGSVAFAGPTSLELLYGPRVSAPDRPSDRPSRPLRRRKPASKASFRSTATGIRTPVSAVRGRRPSPLDDGGQRRGSVARGPCFA
jgi:hypothetical protein